MYVSYRYFNHLFYWFLISLWGSIIFYFNPFWHFYIVFLFPDYEYNPRVIQNNNGLFPCPSCGKLYKHKTSVYTHLKNDCGKLPKYFCKPCDFYCKFDHVYRRHCSSMSHSRKALQSRITKVKLARYPWK